MGDVYSKVATNYDRVSGSVRKNYELIQEDFSKEKVRYEKIKDKEGKKFMKVLEKNNLGAIEMKTKAEFLTKD